MILVEDMKCRQLWFQENENVKERFALSMERIEQIYVDTACAAPFQDYFKRTAGYILMVRQLLKDIEQGEFSKLSDKELLEYNHKLFGDLLPEAYKESSAPTVI